MTDKMEISSFRDLHREIVFLELGEAIQGYLIRVIQGQLWS